MQNVAIGLLAIVCCVFWMIQFPFRGHISPAAKHLDRGSGIIFFRPTQLVFKQLLVPHSTIFYLIDPV